MTRTLFICISLLASGALAQLGVLRVESQPGVEVVWEGVNLGITEEDGSLEISGIPPGEYTVLLRKSGYVEVTTKVTVGNGKRTLDRDLEAVTPPTAPVRESPTMIVPEPTPVPTPIPAATPRPRTEQKSTAARPVPQPIVAPEKKEPREIRELSSPEQTAPVQEIVRPNEVDPAQTKRASEAPSPASPETPERSSGLVLPWLFLVAGGVAAWWIFSRRNAAPATEALGPKETVPAPPSDEPPQASSEAEPEVEAEDSRLFLDDLKAREEHVRSATSIRGGRQVIEVEITDIEVLEEES